MKNATYSLILAAVVLTSACTQAPKGTKTEATDMHQASVTESGQSATACNHQTKIYWTGTKPGGSHNGLIKIKEGGHFAIEKDKLVGGEFTIDMNSIADLDLEDTEMNGKLVGHLKSADFFHVDSFPEAKFVITSVEELSGVPGFTNTIKGNLTIKGITKGISFNAKVTVADGNVSATSDDFVLDRTQWGVNYGSKSIFKELQDKFINDEFGLRIEAYSMK